MPKIDHNLERFFTLPFSFGTVVKDIAANDRRYDDIQRYVDYLLDDSIVPETFSETFKPAAIINSASWDTIVSHYKLALFKKAVSDCSIPSLPYGYHGNDFHRHDALRDDQFSAMRLQIKDDIVKELVRAYIEGGIAAADAKIQPGSIDKDHIMARLVGEYEKSGCINARVKRELFAPSGDGPLVTFLMLVTDRDILIADYCVRSFSRLSDLNFRLAIFCNWVTSENRMKYFSRWRSTYPFVDIIEPEWMTEDQRPDEVSDYGYGLEGPYERCEVPWDRELPKFDSRYCAMVDADFEVLHPAFMRAMIEQLEKSATAGFIGTSSTKKNYFINSESMEKNILNSRVDTWCCIYRKEALSCDVSHLYYHEPLAGEVTLNQWDSSGLKQLALRYIHGYEGPTLVLDYQFQFIHYAAFSKNKHLDETNIDLWRQLMILRKIGHEQLLDGSVYSEHKIRLQQLLRQMGITSYRAETVSQLATVAYNKIFSHVDASNPHKNCFTIPIVPT